MPSPFAEVLLWLQRALDSVGVDWYLFGAQAALIHGVARFTADVDVTVHLGDSDVKLLVDAPSAAGFELPADHRRRRSLPGLALDLHRHPPSSSTPAAASPASSRCTIRLQLPYAPRLRFGDHDHVDQLSLCTKLSRLTVHSAAAVVTRPQIERLCMSSAVRGCGGKHSITRPPLAHESLELRPDGRIELTFKSTWRDGTRAIVFEPHDLLTRLVAAVPPPRFHLLRYFGVLSSHSSLRAEVVPEPLVDPDQYPPPPAPGNQLLLLANVDEDSTETGSRRSRWWWLLSWVRGVCQVEHELPVAHAATCEISGGACGKTWGITTTNLVVADNHCNNDKRDHLAAALNVEHWVARGRDSTGEIEVIANDTDWSHDSDKSLSVARAISLRLPAEVQLWRGRREFEGADRALLATALG